MKSHILLACMLFMGVQLFAQTPADELDDIVQAAVDSRTEVITSANALKALAVDVFVLGVPSPDVDGYVAVTQAAQSDIEALEDEISNSIAAAEAGSDCIDGSNIVMWASLLESLSDDIIWDAALLRTQINAGMIADALTTATTIRAAITQQYALLQDIAAEAQLLQNDAQTYSVRILLVDAAGNPVTGSTGLMGFFGTNNDTGDIIWPDFTAADNEFTGICGTNYTFDAIDGVFDGTGSTTVDLSTLTPGADGFIEVTLSYWSE